ncbi:pyridoxamine 5'-phosphate oxidase family protein [Nocardia vinacea]
MNGGRPSARVLILKDVDRAGWHFAVNAVSQKRRELAANLYVAPTFYWPELVRRTRASPVAWRPIRPQWSRPTFWIVRSGRGRWR